MRQRPQAIWQAEAACRNLDVEVSDPIFFPKPGRPRKETPHSPVCGGCPVIVECKNFAIVHQAVGTWGGMTESDRSKLPTFVYLDLVAKAKREGWYRPYTAVIAADSSKNSTPKTTSKPDLVGISMFGLVPEFKVSSFHF